MAIHALERLLVDRREFDGFVIHAEDLRQTRLLGRRVGQPPAALLLARHGRPVVVRRSRAAVRDADLVAATIHLAAHSAAEERGIPCRTVVYTAQLLPSRCHPPLGFPRRILPGWWNRALWRIADGIFDGLFRGPVNRERARMGLPPVRRFLAHARGSRPIVASDRAFAPVPPDAPGEPVQTGALFLPPAAPLDDAVEAFLRAGPAPVYVGFGSMPDEAPGGTSRTIADGLRGTDGVAAAAAELLERTPPPATRQSLGP